MSIRRKRVSASEKIGLAIWADEAFETCPPISNQHLIRIILRTAHSQRLLPYSFDRANARTGTD